MRHIKYSQNFIKSTKLVDRLIRKSGISSSDTVLEIGSGTGVITERLCKVAKKVISIEKDRKLYQISKQRLGKFDNLELIHGDFLHYRLPKTKYKCFSNIPFNFTADIVRKLLLGPNTPQSAYLFMQKEAAERFMGSTETTQVSLLIRPIFSNRVIYHFRRTDFKPIPSADVVLVSFIKRSPPDICKENYDLYKDFITFCFNQWKKDVKYALKHVFTYKQLQKFGRDFNIDLSNRPSDMCYEKWLKLFNFIIKHKNQVNRVFNGFYKSFINKHKFRKGIYKNIAK